jgi:hypothetical protein
MYNTQITLDASLQDEGAIAPSTSSDRFMQVVADRATRA